MIIPITAWSTVNAIGDTRAAVLSSLAQERTGLGPPPDWFPHPTRTGRIQTALPPVPAAFSAYDCYQSRLALKTYAPLAAAVGRALERWGAERVGLVLATSTGGIDCTEAALDYHREHARLPDGYDMERQHNFYAFCDLLRKTSGIRGPDWVVSTACSSSAKVFASAARLLELDLCDAVLVGGVDSLCKTTLYGFSSLNILSAEACRPFGKHRNGISLGEGGALLLLERAGDSRLALLGVGESSDGHHMTSPHPEGAGAVLAIERALRSAELAPEDIDHVNAHGTGTVQNDLSEARAIHQVFGARVPVVSTKCYTGHTLGSAGAMEAALSCLCLEEQFIPANLGADPLDEEVAIQVCTQFRRAPLQKVLSNSFGFGGNNAAVVLGVRA
jgi:3-oxoacyl-[acyl-carrier-protein] synthase-1